MNRAQEQQSYLPEEEQQWSCIYDHSKNLLMRYQSLLVFYMKAFYREHWTDRLQRDAMSPWTPTDVLEEINFQRSLISAVGASNEVFEIIPRLKKFMIKEPQTDSDRNYFCSLINRLIDAFPLNSLREKSSTPIPNSWRYLIEIEPNYYRSENEAQLCAMWIRGHIDAWKKAAAIEMDRVSALTDREFRHEMKDTFFEACSDTISSEYHDVIEEDDQTQVVEQAEQTEQVEQSKDAVQVEEAVRMEEAEQTEEVEEEESVGSDHQRKKRRTVVNEGTEVANQTAVQESPGGQSKIMVTGDEVMTLERSIYVNGLSSLANIQFSSASDFRAQCRKRKADAYRKKRNLIQNQTNSENQVVAETQTQAMEVTETQPEATDLIETQTQAMEVTENQPEPMEVTETQTQTMEVTEIQPEVLDVTETQPEVLDVTETQPEVLDTTETQTEVNGTVEATPEAASEATPEVETKLRTPTRRRKVSRRYVCTEIEEAPLEEEDKED
eukprot:g2488.t1